MCETVLEYFKSIHVARDIRDGIQWRNVDTGELASIHPSQDGVALADDASINDMALRIVTEAGWVRP